MGRIEGHGIISSEDICGKIVGIKGKLLILAMFIYMNQHDEQKMVVSFRDQLFGGLER